jgi:hypothetical protein
MKIRAIHPATVIAVAALLFSLTGTAVAGALITGAQVKNGSLTTKDVKDNTLTSGDIKNGTIKPVDLKGGSFPTGPQGPEGPQGPAGPQGVAGLSGHQIVWTQSALNSTAYKFSFAACPAGKRVVGGGAYVLGVPKEIGVVASYPASASAWFASAHELPAVYLANWRIKTFAICATVAA